MVAMLKILFWERRGGNLREYLVRIQHGLSRYDVLETKEKPLCYVFCLSLCQFVHCHGLIVFSHHELIVQ